MCSTCRPFELPKATLARTARWSQSLQLPSCTTAFRTLMLQRPPDQLVVIADAAVGRYFTTSKDQRVLHRVWGYLLLQEPGLAAVPIAPFAAAIGARAFPTAPIFALETSLHFLINIAPSVYQDAVLLALDAKLRSRAPLLHRHLASIGCPPNIYLGLLCERAFLSSFSTSEWMEFADLVFTAVDGDAVYFRAAIAVLELLAKQLMLAVNSAQVIEVLETQVVPVAKLKSRLLTYSDVMVPLPAKRGVLNPKAPSQYLSLLSMVLPLAQAPAKRVDEAAELLNRISLHERDVLRERENKLKCLEMALCDARRLIALGVGDESLRDRMVLGRPTGAYGELPQRCPGPHGDDDDDDCKYDDAQPRRSSRVPSSARVDSAAAAADDAAFESRVLSDRSPSKDAGENPVGEAVARGPSTSVKSPTPDRPSSRGSVSVVPIYSVRFDGRSTPRSADSKFLDASAAKSSSRSAAVNTPSPPLQQSVVAPAPSATATHAPTLWIASPTSSVSSRY